MSSELREILDIMEHRQDKLIDALSKIGIKAQYNGDINDWKLTYESLNQVWYYDSAWHRDANGKVSYERFPPAEAPQWVQNAMGSSSQDYEARFRQWEKDGMKATKPVPLPIRVQLEWPELTTPQQHLLRYLAAAILAASPAKVD
jgi:hypothetical protein